MALRLSIRLVGLLATLGALAAIPSPAGAQSSAPVVLDHVVAVVNNRPILASDVEDEIRLSILDSNQAMEGSLTPQHALEQLISRALVEQQMRREDEDAAQPDAKEVEARISDLRKQLPACVRRNCESDTGWQAFLTAHDLTPGQVQAYIRYRLEILRFIEDRFRPGIRVSPQEIESYYRNKLAPQYSDAANVPSLTEVSSRIEEILLEEQVNVLFDQWLTNLRGQGDVEILDSSFESAQKAPTGGAQ
jgi:peptidyl-prolyl cis-trans isomerase SurA